MEGSVIEGAVNSLIIVPILILTWSKHDEIV